MSFNAFSQSIQFRNGTVDQITVIGKGFNSDEQKSYQVNFYISSDFIADINTNDNGSFSYTFPKGLLANNSTIIVKVLDYNAPGKHFIANYVFKAAKPPIPRPTATAAPTPQKRPNINNSSQQESYSCDIYASKGISNAGNGTLYTLSEIKISNALVKTNTNMYSYKNAELMNNPKAGVLIQILDYIPNNSSEDEILRGTRTLTAYFTNNLPITLAERSLPQDMIKTTNLKNALLLTAQVNLNSKVMSILCKKIINN